MIKVNELRIRNWVKDKYDNFIQVNSVDENGINVSTLEGDLFWDFNLDELFGIPLTPEILERCGFKKDKRYSGNQSYSNEGIIIEETNGGYELFASEWTIGETFFYLHELQNICFDLFKFELEIKELQTD